MMGFHRSRRTPTRCTLDTLSDHQLKDIGLSRSGIVFAVAAGTDSQSSVDLPCAQKRLATRVLGSETHLAAIGTATTLILALVLLIAFAGTVHIAGVPIVDMRL